MRARVSSCTHYFVMSLTRHRMSTAPVGDSTSGRRSTAPAAEFAVIAVPKIAVNGSMVYSSLTHCDHISPLATPGDLDQHAHAGPEDRRHRERERGAREAHHTFGIRHHDQGRDKSEYQLDNWSETNTEEIGDRQRSCSTTPRYPVPSASRTRSNPAMRPMVVTSIRIRA